MSLLAVYYKNNRTLSLKFRISLKILVCKKWLPMSLYTVWNKKQPSATYWIIIEMLHVAIVVPFVYHCNILRFWHQTLSPFIYRVHTKKWTVCISAIIPKIQSQSCRPIWQMKMHIYSNIVLKFVRYAMSYVCKK